MYTVICICVHTVRHFEIDVSVTKTTHQRQKSYVFVYFLRLRKVTTTVSPVITRFTKKLLFFLKL